MLAKALGAEIKVLYAQDIAKALTDWCDLAHMAKLNHGRSEQPRWKDSLNSHSLISVVPHHFKLEIVRFIIFIQANLQIHLSKLKNPLV